MFLLLLLLLFLLLLILLSLLLHFQYHDEFSTFLLIGFPGRKF